MSIPWEDLGRQKFEDMVSVLLSRLHPDSQRIDGKGGDGGRDVQIVCPGDGSVIDAFELKSFTGRMGDVQRPQVKRSLNRVASLRGCVTNPLSLWERVGVRASPCSRRNCRCP